MEKAIHGLSHRCHLRSVPGAFAVKRCIARSQQKDIPLAERNAQRLGNDRQELSARYAASAFDEAEVPLRNSGVKRQIKLTLAPLLSPVAKQIAQFLYFDGLLGCHLSSFPSRQNWSGPTAPNRVLTLPGSRSSM